MKMDAVIFKVRNGACNAALRADHALFFSKRSARCASLRNHEATLPAVGRYHRRGLSSLKESASTLIHFDADFYAHESSEGKSRLHRLLHNLQILQRTQIPGEVCTAVKSRAVRDAVQLANASRRPSCRQQTSRPFADGGGCPSRNAVLRMSISAVLLQRCGFAHRPVALRCAALHAAGQAPQFGPTISSSRGPSSRLAQDGVLPGYRDWHTPISDRRLKTSRRKRRSATSSNCQKHPATVSNIQQR